MTNTEKLTVGSIEMFKSAHEQLNAALNSGVITTVNGKFAVDIDVNDLAALSHDLHALTKAAINFINAIPREIILDDPTLNEDISFDDVSAGTVFKSPVADVDFQSIELSTGHHVVNLEPMRQKPHDVALALKPVLATLLAGQKPLVFLGEKMDAELLLEHATEFRDQLLANASIQAMLG